jgi:hypothetical protein
METKKESVSAYDTLIQKTKDRIQELQMEGLTAGKTAEEVIKLKLAHDLERAAKGSGKVVTSTDRAEWDRLGDQLAKVTEFNSRMRELKSTAGEFASGFAKDLSHGLNVMDALRNAAGKLGDQLIDIGTKKLVSMAVEQTASMFGPATAASTVFTTTAQTMGATWIASAEIAALILGGATKTEAIERVLSAQTAGATVAAGGAAGGAALEAGGIVAGLAINGPMIAVMAAIVALGATVSAFAPKTKPEAKPDPANNDNTPQTKGAAA